MHGGREPIQSAFSARSEAEKAPIFYVFTPKRNLEVEMKIFSAKDPCSTSSLLPNRLDRRIGRYLADLSAHGPKVPLHLSSDSVRLPPLSLQTVRRALALPDQHWVRNWQMLVVEMATKSVRPEMFTRRGLHVYIFMKI